MTDTQPVRYAVAVLAAAAFTLAMSPQAAIGQIPDSTRVPDPLLDSLAAIDSLLLADSWQAADSSASLLPISETTREHFAYLTEVYFDTPGAMGLIPTGMAEAAIAAEYVAIAGRDPLNLNNMVANMRHVIHAIDPTAVGSGRGLGYGFKRAAQGVLTQIELATAEELLPEAVIFHKPYIVNAATGALSRADDAIAMARQVQQSTTPEVALSRLERLTGLVRAMAFGDDRDGDGRIGGNEAESGLARATYHLNLLYRMAGIPIRGQAPTDTTGLRR